MDAVRQLVCLGDEVVQCLFVLRDVLWLGVCCPWIVSSCGVSHPRPAVFSWLCVFAVLWRCGFVRVWYCVQRVRTA